MSTQTISAPRRPKRTTTTRLSTSSKRTKTAPSSSPAIQTPSTCPPSPPTQTSLPLSPFFTLPRELRDAIYTHLLSQKPPPAPPQKGTTKKLRRKIRATHSRDYELHYLPALAFQLVSRQFGSEYTEAIREESMLVIYTPYEPDFVWKSVIKKVGWVRVYLPLRCGAGIEGGSENKHPKGRQVKVDDGTIQKHGFTCSGVTEAEEWVDRLRNTLPHLPAHDKLEVRVGLWWDSDSKLAWPKHIHAPGLQYHLDAMTEVSSKVKSVKVALFDYDKDYLGWTKGRKEMEFWASWAREGGWRAGEAKGRTIDQKRRQKEEEEARLVAQWGDMLGTMRAMDNHW